MYMVDMNLDVKYTKQCMCLSGRSTHPDHLTVNNVKQIACVCLMLKNSARPFVLNLPTSRFTTCMFIEQNGVHMYDFIALSF